MNTNKTLDKIGNIFRVTGITIIVIIVIISILILGFGYILSNISNNCKNRKLLNRTYMIMLMAYGLDAAIMDPSDDRLMQAIKTSDILLNKKLYADAFLKG